MSLPLVLRVSQSALVCGALFAAAGATWAAESRDTGESKTEQAALPLDQQVISLLQRTAKALESGSVEPAEEADFRALIAASETLKTDRTLVPAERVRLEALVRIRLRHAAEAINRQAAREAKKTPPVRLPDAPPVSTLAQIPGAAGAGGQAFGPGQAFAGGIGAQTNGGADRQAEKLIDLIQAVISPNSWDVNGGQGVIRYWSLGHGLVIRNTHAEHDKVGDVLQQLR
jgi:hypothetical protein